MNVAFTSWVLFLIEILWLITRLENRSILFAGVVHELAGVFEADLEFSIAIPFQRNAFVEMLGNVANSHSLKRAIGNSDEFAVENYTPKIIR
jgi:hypothetical protein